MKIPTFLMEDSHISFSGCLGLPGLDISRKFGVVIQMANVEFGIRAIPFQVPLLPRELLDHRDWGILGNIPGCAPTQCEGMKLCVPCKLQDIPA